MSVKHIGIGAGAGASLMAIVMNIANPQIANLEGTRYQAYKDIGGVLTVCNGHTGPDVSVEKVYSPSECQSLTAQDAQKAASGVLRTSPQLLYHPMQLAAAVSFSYNVGVGTYDKSSVARDFNTGNFYTACNDLMKYTYVDGKYSTGLANRRAQELAICLSTLTPKGLTNVGLDPQSSK